VRRDSERFESLRLLEVVPLGALEFVVNIRNFVDLSRAVSPVPPLMALTLPVGLLTAGAVSIAVTHVLALLLRKTLAFITKTRQFTPVDEVVNVAL